MLKLIRIIYMFQEFERIIFHLVELQKELLQNQFPGIALKHIDRLVEKKNFEDGHLLQQFIQGLINIERQLFITPIARNIHSIKEQNMKLKNEAEGFKSQIIDCQTQKNYIVVALNQMEKQKNILGLKLNMNDSIFEELEKVIASSDILKRVKEIIKQGEQLKEKLRLRDLMIEERSVSLREMVEKEIFYLSQIRALQNDNCLFHRDLTSCSTQIQTLTEEIQKLKDEKEKLQREYQDLKQADKCIRQQKEDIEKALRLQKERILQLEDHIKKDNIILTELNDQIGQKIQLIQQLKKKQDQYKKEAESLSNFVNELQITNSEINKCNDKKDVQIGEYKQQIQEIKGKANDQINEKQRQIRNIQSDLAELKLNLTEVKDNFKQQNQVLSADIEKLKLQVQFYKQREKILEQKQFQNLQNFKKSESQLVNAKEQLALMFQKLEFSNSEVRQLEELNQDYKLYQQENIQLKQQLLNIYKKPHIKYKNLSKKEVFQLILLQEKLQCIKTQNQRIKNLLQASFESMEKWMVLSINKLFSILMEAKIQKTSFHQSNELSTLISVKEPKTKNSMRQLKDRYQLIRSQNQIIRNRIKFVLSE